MNLNEYKELAEKTLSTQFHSDPQMEKILHAALGLATEIEELLVNYSGYADPVNILEEVGDLTWYLSIFYREYPEIENVKVSASETYYNRGNPHDLIMDMMKGILQIQDIIKKKLYYNKPVNQETMNLLVATLDSNIRMYLELYELKIEDVWEKNIAKLKARYGEKFSSERAINRDLETERTILEGGK
jgi:NTP pyrophosphatase (non-canonical NTP hydrolase)